MMSFLCYFLYYCSSTYRVIVNRDMLYLVFMAPKRLNVFFGTQIPYNRCFILFSLFLSHTNTFFFFIRVTSEPVTMTLYDREAVMVVTTSVCPFKHSDKVKLTLFWYFTFHIHTSYSKILIRP